MLLINNRLLYSIKISCPEDDILVVVILIMVTLMMVIMIVKYGIP